MSALRSLTFTTIPKIGANPTLDRRTNIIARLEGEKRRAAHADRQAAARLALVAGERGRVLCVLYSIRVESG
jgi:hypothetical protein